MKDSDFSRRLLAWYGRHGRKDLPWQASRDPYHIWVSEIMLQQTQVTTVIPYFERFIERFPDIASLAQAGQDEVLHYWTGLGYYARARNLHRAAGVVMEKHGGRFPREFEQVRELPGIGASTAGAILAFTDGQRHAILDGNVKRVLARYRAVSGWPGKREVETRLWALAERYTPKRRIEEYTQAIMDLGATVCRRGKPACDACPLAAGCQTRRQGNPEAYPEPRPRKTLPVKAVTMLMIRDHNGRILLQRRPPAGVWGGLWGFPECTAEDPAGWCRDRLGIDVRPDPPWASLRHTFSHFHLDITPIAAQLLRTRPRIMENEETVWYNLSRPDARGFAAPVKRLLEQLRKQS